MVNLPTLLSSRYHAKLTSNNWDPAASYALAKKRRLPPGCIVTLAGVISTLLNGPSTTSVAVAWRGGPSPVN